MNINTILDAVTANEGSTAIDLWALLDHFGAGRGKEITVMYCPTADYDGDIQMQTDTVSAFSSPTALGSNQSGTGVLIERVTPTERYLRCLTANRSAGSVSVYLLGAP